eukprot:TRINITY_DN11457_c0_g1_i1.p1 TRINITY_DN11457_c0_g1~~TRINITY_DN11457_c0_g1_i1.p1  ORF type:complete len:452 (-),score=113.09 TRINITY_DN11457_c0_g1_i1:39-1367(-)
MDKEVEATEPILTPRSLLTRRLLCGELDSLTELNLSNAKLFSLPDEFSRLGRLERLNLGNNSLSALPPSFGKLSSLRVLFFLNNRFVSVPTVLAELPKLFMVSFKSNQLTTIDEGALPPSVCWLILTDNKLTALPHSIGQLRGLRKLMLAKNQLTALPQEITNCTELELVRLSQNSLTALPEGFLQLPKLTWLALAGNPLSAMPPTGVDCARLVDASSVVLADVLGEGASGVVHKAAWTDPSTALQSQVAVKMFKSGGSDGLPADEIAASSRTDHQNIVRVLATIPNGMILELLPPSVRNLANPPSFDTVTRDVYPTGVLSKAVAFRVLESIAAACAHIHERHLAHGDIYGHNILLDEQTGDTKLCDFGASFFYGPEEQALFERIEVRAFGVLIGEMQSASGAVLHGDDDVLQQLSERCVHENVQNRPTFAEILAQLAALKT